MAFFTYDKKCNFIVQVGIVDLMSVEHVIAWTA